MVSEDNPGEATEPRSVRAAFPLLLGIGGDERGEHNPPTALVDLVSIGHHGYPDRAIVIDKDGVYITYRGQCRELYRWTDRPEGPFWID